MNRAGTAENHGTAENEGGAGFGKIAQPDGGLATLVTCISRFRDAVPATLEQLDRWDAACQCVGRALDAMVDPDYVDHAYDHVVWLTRHPPFVPRSTTSGSGTRGASLRSTASTDQTPLTVLVHVDAVYAPPLERAMEVFNLVSSTTQLRFTSYPWFYLMPG